MEGEEKQSTRKERGEEEGGVCPYRSDTSQEEESESSSSTVFGFANNEFPANQLRLPGQRTELSTRRLTSNIPRHRDRNVDGTSTTTTSPQQTTCPAASRDDENDRWIYPSEQMFYNALKRKGYGHINEEDMKSVVAIHNTVNERAWEEVMQWERSLHPNSSSRVKLDYFKGKPKELSPKARWKHWILGYALPFDRHDWTIDRDGEKIRYVIDFYNGKRIPGMPASIYIDTRPAIDSPNAVFDRCRMFVRKRFGRFFSFDSTRTEAPREGDDDGQSKAT